MFEVAGRKLPATSIQTVYLTLIRVMLGAASPVCAIMRTYCVVAVVVKVAVFVPFIYM